MDNTVFRSGRNVLREGKPAEVGMDSDRIARIPGRAQAWIDCGDNQALVLLAARKGMIVLHQAFGRLCPEPEAPPTPLDAIFPISSISKVVTAAAVMLLVEDGLVGLNRPVREYIPEFAGEGKDAVMVHHLLTHTMGWDEATVEAYLEERRGKIPVPPCPPTQHPAVHEDLCLVYDAPLIRPPGVEMSYCSPGFNLAGEIVRRVSGRSLEDFAQERIFVPLGMKDTTYTQPDSTRSRVVRRRPLDPPPFGLDNPEYHRQPWPESGVLSTALDMATFGQMFLNRGTYGGERILSPATVAAMTRNQIPGISALFLDEHFPEAGWGYGWAIENGKSQRRGSTLVSRETFAHGGSGGVYLWADPVAEIVGVYFSVARLQERYQPLWHVDHFADMVTASVL